MNLEAVRVATKHLTRHKDNLSNFDHVVPDGLEEDLKNPGMSFCCEYCGWNFHGDVWYDHQIGQFKCAAMQYHELIEVVVDDTLFGIMQKVSETYGDA